MIHHPPFLATSDRDDRAGEQVLADFYNDIRFGAPWPVVVRPDDPEFPRRMLAQDIGQWGQEVLPPQARVWVAGCGAFEAIAIALRFPDAHVIGSDLASESLELCASRASALSLTNLELRQENINTCGYRQHFDYIVCSVVIHHNPDPTRSLANLAEALRPSGLMEVFVYNTYHRAHITSMQQAIRILWNDKLRHLPVMLPWVRGLGRDLARDPRTHAMARLTGGPDAVLADTLLHPSERGYTVADCAAMARACGLEMLSFRIDPYSLSTGSVDWNLTFEDEQLRNAYESLPDVERWQVTNLLLGESSARLWFYYQRVDAPRQRLSEQEMCQAFLDRRFTRANVGASLYSLRSDGEMDTNPHRLIYPGTPDEPVARAVYEELDERRPIREIVLRHGGKRLAPLNQLCCRLMTSACPFLLAQP